MRTRTYVAIVGAACLLELGVLAVAFREPLTEHGGGIPYLQPPTLDVELLDAPAPIILNGCFKALIRTPGKPVAPCAEAPREAAGEPVPAAVPSYVPPAAALPEPYPLPQVAVQPDPIVTWTAPAPLVVATPYVPRELPHVGGGFFDRAPPCYRSETPCPR
jgi:hypothetical protein